MNIAVSNVSTLPSLIDRAAQILQGARSAAEILEARDMAGVAYDAAKRAARLLKAKGAFNDVVAAAARAQADALEIEAGANRRLADEYDAAQERGEVASHGGDRKIKVPEANLENIGITKKQVHHAREIRDAEEASPGIIRQALDKMLESGEEPTRAKVSRVIKPTSKRTRGPRFSAPVETQHDRDLRMLLGVWETSCESARTEFLQTVN